MESSTIEVSACIGGKNVLLDSFSLLEQLRMESPQHFATLANMQSTVIFMLPLHRGGNVAPRPDFRYQCPHMTLDSSGRVSALSVHKYHHCTKLHPKVSQVC